MCEAHMEMCKDSRIEKKLKIIQAELCWAAGEFSLLAECVRLKYQVSVIFRLLIVQGMVMFIGSKHSATWNCAINWGCPVAISLIFTNFSVMRTFICVYNKATAYDQI